MFTDEATTAQEIRALDSSRFIPLVFLASANEDVVSERYIDLGVDHFLHGSVESAELQTCLLTMDRVRSLYDRFGKLFRRLKKDEETAESVFSGAVLAHNVAMEQISTLLKPADVFSGDVLLSAYSPSGDINIVLGDFTGHGLAAAIGALPASEVFRAMTNKGFSAKQILSGINEKLYRLLPTSMFFAVQFISINRSLDRLMVCNCGMPDILLIDGTSGRIRQRFTSRSLPLSISPEIDYQDAVEYTRIDAGDQILLMSDGVLEARNPAKEYFGEIRLEKALVQPRDSADLLAALGHALDTFRSGAPQDDDISMAAIPCIPALFPPFAPQEPDPSAEHRGENQAISNVDTQDKSEFTLTLSGDKLREVDPVPLLINHIREIEGPGHHWRSLFTVLTELYINALDHGVLGLNSTIKQQPGGFDKYLEMRALRLERLESGSITLRIISRPAVGGGTIECQIEDSGNGFDSERWLKKDPQRDSQQLSGRGIALVRELCEQVRYELPGNRVSVIFSWAN